VSEKLKPLSTTRLITNYGLWQKLILERTHYVQRTYGKVVDVYGFHDTFNAIRNIKVGTCITAFDLQGETVIACFPHSLYFGDSMENSLVPPAQFRAHGATVDVVTKQYSNGKLLHGIHHANTNVFIPFQ
jgi:hypothetical protein